MAAFRGAYRGLDRFQRRHGWLGFVLAVRQKYADDQGGYLAATLTCYAFFAVFPLLLLLVTGLGFALSGDVGLQRRVLYSVLAQFPIIGPQLQRNVHSLRGSGVALFIGVAGSLWAGMASPSPNRVSSRPTAMTTASATTNPDASRTPVPTHDLDRVRPTVSVWRMFRRRQG